MNSPAAVFEFDASASAVAHQPPVLRPKPELPAPLPVPVPGPATGTQAKTSYFKGMAVFVHAKGGLMYEAAIGGQKFSFEPLE